MNLKNLLFVLLATAGFCLSFNPAAQAQQPCGAGFNYVVTQSPNGTVIAFTDSSYAVGTITNWDWTFSTGQVSTSQNPVITVNGGGPITACLTITAIYQGVTCTSTVCDSISTTVFPPVCDAGFAYTVTPQGVQFVATGQNNVSWNWSFGDGTSGSGISAFHQYSPGTYTVCLTVLDANGTTCNSCQTITVSSTAGCQAYFTATPLSGTTIVDFTDMSQGNPTDFFWTFGDGSTSTQQNPSHTYNSTGPFIVCLTITDSVAGCSDTFCDSLYIGGGFVCDPTFTFQNSPAATVFVANSQTNVSWTWDFGDGNVGTGGPAITHVYASPGTYTACLTVVTANGQTCTSCQAVTISSGSGCSSNYAIYPDSILPSTYYAYNLATGVAPITYVWTWGDGTSSTGRLSKPYLRRTRVYTPYASL